MRHINISELRSSLPSYLSRVKKGEEILVTSRGKAIARIVPVQDQRQESRVRLKKLRAVCTVGDVVTPIGEAWNADNACS
jgi:prevent-host-death family protein